MSINKTFLNTSLLLITIMSLFSCSGQRPTNLGINNGKFTACPSSPNCISSDASDDDHKILPLKLIPPHTESWKIATATVLELPRTNIVSVNDNYLHAECKSAVFGFVDDLELHFRPSDEMIAIRSASRLGHSDFGVNRKRIETLRNAFIKRGISE